MIDSPKTLTLPFLGSRTYLHGTTLFLALLEQCSEPRNLCFKFSSVVFSDRINILPFDPEHDLPPESSAALFWTERETHRATAVTALEASSSPERLPYDEDRLVVLAEFNDKEVVLENESPYSFISTIVALNKAMLLRELNPPSGGQWLFTRVDLEHVPQDFLPLRISLERDLGFRIVHSKIHVAGTAIGDLYFSWWRK